MSHPQINYRIAQAYWACGENEQAKEYFLAELRINPGDIEVIFDYGLFLHEISDTEAAKEKFNRILEFDPNHAPALFYRGEIAFGDGDYERAVELYKKAIEFEPELQGPQYRLAQYALTNGDKTQAKSYLLSEMKLALEDGETLVSMGSMFLNVDDLGCATHCLLRAVDSDSSSADAYYYLGLTSVLRDELHEAAELFSHALDIKSDHVPALRDSAYVYLMMKKFDRALNRIKKARIASPEDKQIKSLERKILIEQIINRVKGFVSKIYPIGKKTRWKNH